MQFRKLIALAAMLVGIGANTQAAPVIGSLYGTSGEWYIYAYREGLDNKVPFNGGIACYMTRFSYGLDDISAIKNGLGLWFLEFPSSLPKGTALDVPFKLDGNSSGSTGYRFVMGEHTMNAMLNDILINALDNVETLTLNIQGRNRQFSLNGFGPASRMTRECHQRRGVK